MGNGLLTPSLGTGRIPLQMESQGEQAGAGHLRILFGRKHQAQMFVFVIEAHSAFHVNARLLKVPASEKYVTQRVVAFDPVGYIAGVLADANAFFGQFFCDIKIIAYYVQCAKPPQHWVQGRNVAQSVANLSSPRQGVTHFVNCIAA